MLQEVVTCEFCSLLLNNNNFGNDEHCLLSGMPGSLNMGFEDMN